MISSKPISSLSLQILFYFDGLYTLVYLILQLSVFVYKGYSLNYTKVTIGFEVSAVFVFVIVQEFRLFVGIFYSGSVGNKTEEVAPLIYMLLVSVIAVIGPIYFLVLQTYV
jgi:Predicted membrane protein